MLPTPDDPRNPPLVTLGEANVDINLGAVRLSEPLDFDISPGTAIGGNLALVYNSATVNVEPIIPVAIAPNSLYGTLEEIEAQLTWNGGTAEPAVTFTPDGPNEQVIGVQQDAPVAESGENGWEITYTLTYSGGSQTGRASGNLPVVVQDSSVSGQQDPYGAGWGIDSVDRLIPTTGGILWEYGTGDGEFFTSTGGGSYTSPTGNYGTLTAVSGGYNYTANGSIQE